MRAQSPESDEDENMYNDIALQNLLSGKTKVLASVKNGQTNLPMSIQRGIQKKRRDGEEDRRKYARDAAIVLERALKSKRDPKRRKRAVTGPSVGKFRGGTLRLTSRDLHDIQGSEGTR
jgi:hypothetical protein